MLGGWESYSSHPGGGAPQQAIEGTTLTLEEGVPGAAPPGIMGLDGAPETMK